LLKKLKFSSAAGLHALQLSNCNRYHIMVPLLLLLLLSLLKMQNACPGANPCKSSSSLAEQPAADTGAGSNLVRQQAPQQSEQQCLQWHRPRCLAYNH
jgi:hypothetical protein